jgi:hypothetical protein
MLNTIPRASGAASSRLALTASRLTPASEHEPQKPTPRRVWMEFTDAINEHLELRRRNAQLEPTLPLERYRTDPRARNERPLHPHAETAPEETVETSPAWPAPSEADRNRDADPSRLWDLPPVFDWGE